MSKIKDLIKNQAENSINRIQNDYNWRNSLFEENENQETNILPVVKDSGTPREVNLTSNGVNNTPYSVPKTTQVLDGNYGNTPVVNEMNIIYGVEKTPEDANKIPHVVNKTPYGNMITPHDVKNTTDNFNEIQSGVSKTSFDVNGTPQMLSSGVNSTTQPTVSDVNNTTQYFISGVDNTTDGVDITPIFPNIEVVSTTQGVFNTTQSPLTGVNKTTTKEAIDVNKTPLENDHGVTSTPHVVKKTSTLGTNKTPLLGQTSDLYLIGLWHVLNTIFPDGYGHYTLRSLAKRLNMDHSNLLRSLKRAENAGLLKRVASKEVHILK